MFNRWPKANPFDPDHKMIEDVRLDDFKEFVPNFIASVEKAFPGAIYMPLGRDSAMLGDVVDAFYQSIGQQGRVRRLNASGTSFQGADESTVLGFLQSNGFDSEKVLEGPPLIIFDYTSYGENSQSRQLIRAGYMDFMRKHGNVKRLVYKFNLVSTQGGTPIEIDAELNAERFLNQENKVVNENGPKNILSAGGRGLHYTLEWHDTFHGFERRKNGMVIARPGAQSDQDKRQWILASLYEIVNFASAPSFLRAVRAEARALGYKFSVKPVPIKILSPYIEKGFPGEKAFLKDLKQVVDALGPESDEAELFSENMIQLAGWLNQRAKLRRVDAVGMAFVRGLIQARVEGKLNSWHFEHLLYKLLSRIKPGNEFMRRFVDQLRVWDVMKEAWNDESGIYGQDMLPGAKEADAAYEAILRYMRSNGCEYLLREM